MGHELSVEVVGESGGWGGGVGEGGLTKGNLVASRYPLVTLFSPPHLRILS